MSAFAEAERVASQLRLDALASSASGALSDAGIPHLLLKGPTTAVWLYDPPRRYADVDILIPRSLLKQATSCLAAAGVASPGFGRYGEGSLHSWTLRALGANTELDLHVSLPSVPVDSDDPDQLWKKLSPHIEEFEIAGMSSTVPALDVPGRCLVLALHCFRDGGRGHALADLRLARQLATPEEWQAAGELARDLGVLSSFTAGLVFAEANVPHDTSDRVQQVRQRLADIWAAPRRQLPSLLWQEVLPSRAWMEWAGWPAGTRWELCRSHLRRWRLRTRETARVLRDRG